MKKQQRTEQLDRQASPPFYGYAEDIWWGFSAPKRSRIRNSKARVAYNKARAQRNPGQYAATKKAWKDRNPSKHHDSTRASWLKSKYGITPEDYDQMLVKQHGCCGICGVDAPSRGNKYFAVDHCHKTGRVRGLLCNECNRGMGLLRDSSDLCRKAAEYLETQSERSAAPTE